MLSTLKTSFKDLAPSIAPLRLADNLLSQIDEVREAIGDETIIIIGEEYWDPAAPNDFFIRPEDIDLYRPCLLEFPSSWSKEKRKAFEEMYEQKNQFQGSLGILFPRLDKNLEIPNPAIDPRWGERRSKCGQRCYRCHYCDLALRTAKLIKKPLE